MLKGPELLARCPENEHCTFPSPQPGINRLTFAAGEPSSNV